MKGYILNPDKEYVSGVIEGIYKKEGHCPCRVIRDDTTLCPCDEFIDKGICKCKLYIKVADAAFEEKSDTDNKMENETETEKSQVKFEVKDKE